MKIHLDTDLGSDMDDLCALAMLLRWPGVEITAITTVAEDNGKINFQHDPLTCAIALGWNEGVEITEIPLRLESRDGWLREIVDTAGKPTKVVTRIDGNRFNEF